MDLDILKHLIQIPYYMPAIKNMTLSIPRNITNQEITSLVQD